MPPVNYFQAIGAVLRAAAAESRPAAADRIAAFEAWEGYYHNTIYEPLRDGGQREQINATLGNASAADLAGLYNPVAEAVDLYQHVLGGQFRRATDAPADDAPTDIRVIADRAPIAAAVDQIYGWSGINLLKQQACRLPALHGTAGLRIVAVNDRDTARRRVYLKAEHPRIIRDVELDARGNVTAIELVYSVTEGLGDAQEVITVREELTRERIRVWRSIGEGVGAGAPSVDTENLLGVVPYVLIRHQDMGDAFGLNCWYRARTPIDRLNALLTHINGQIHDHVKVDWFIAAAGKAPERVVLNGRNIIYTDTSAGGEPPTAMPLVAPLSLADAISQARLLIGEIENRLPELKATSGTYLAGQSGETVAQLRAPAEHRLSLARAAYEDALVRAGKIALSWGVLMGLWDLGTGTGSRDAADRAYRSGAEDHQFNRRPLLPPVTTPTAQAAQAAPAPPMEEP